MASPDKFALYEACVTDAQRLALFMRAVHGGRARVLREDFSGTAALARAWAGLSERHGAVAVDSDAGVLRRMPGAERVRAVAADVMRCGAGADVIAATNFPVCYWHTRRELLAYLRACRRRLRPRGVFVCDLYGGSDAFTEKTTRVRAPSGTSLGLRGLVYEWRTVRADAVTGRVLNTISFEWREGTRRRRIEGAFTYDWRLWSLPEMREAMLEAGFRAVEVYDRLAGAIDHTGVMHVRPLARGEGLDDPWVAYAAARR